MIRYILLLAANLVFANDLIVEMNQKLNWLQRQKILRLKGVKSLALFDNVPTDYFQRTYRIQIDENNEKTLNRLQSFHFVKEIERVEQVEKLSIFPPADYQKTVNDQLFQYQWGMQNQGQQSLVEIDDITSYRITGKKDDDIGWQFAKEFIDKNMKDEVTVAVIDSGFDLQHPDLQGAFKKNLEECDEDGNTPTGDKLSDNDQNGFKGDCLGWDFTKGPDMPGANDVTYNDDFDHHGTHVAGIIAARTNNIGVAGISNKIKILPIKVLGASPFTTSDRLAWAINYAARMKEKLGVEVINMSLGWPNASHTKHLSEAVNFALSRGITIVAAAGNNSTNDAIFPCALREVICVGSVGIDGTLSPFSNYGSVVDVLAPGEKILSTIPHKEDTNIFAIQGYDYLSGTSQAAPFVSAMAAVIKGIYPQSDRAQITARILEGAGFYNGDSQKRFVAHGLVNLDKSLKLREKPAIKPVFKMARFLSYFATRDHINYQLPIKNYWKRAENIKITVQSLSDHVQLNETTFNFESLEFNQVQAINLRGQILDENAESLFRYKIKITSDNQESQEFLQEARIVKHFENDPNLKTQNIEFQGSPVSIATIRENAIVPLISTIEDTYNQGTSTQFMRIFKKEEFAKGYQLIVFDLEKDKLAEKKQRANIPDASELVAIKRLDLNYDGQLDYFIISRVFNQFRRVTNYIISYLDKDLNPLFGANRSHWIYRPEALVATGSGFTALHPNINGLRFLSHHLPGIGRVAIPAFVDFGRLPLAQQNDDPWQPLDMSVRKRFYMLVPELQDNNISISTRVLLDHQNIDLVKSQLGLQWYEAINMITSVAQSLQDFKRGVIKIVSFAGIGLNEKRFSFELSSTRDFSLEKAQVGSSDLLSANVTAKSVIDLSDNQVNKFWGTSYFNIYDMTKIRLTLVSGARDVGVSMINDYVHQQTYRDKISNYVGTYYKNGETFNFLETRNRFVMAKTNVDGETKISEQPIIRFAFITGQALDSRYYPVFMKRRGELVPALYEDGTMITANRVHSYIVDENDRLISPINTSVFVPSNCKAMNPISTNESFSYVFLCLEEQNWILKSFDI